MGFFRQCIASYTLMLKECHRIVRIWSQSLIPPAITTSMYFIVFGNLLGDKIQLGNDVSYIQFMTPGLIMLSIISNSYVNVCSSFFSAKFQKSIEELMVASINNVAIIIGYVGGGLFRGLATGTVVCIIGMLFTEITIHSWAMVFAFAILTSIVFSLAGFTNAIFAKKFDDIAIVPTFVLTPLIYLGGVFHSVSSLPQHWQSLSMANPIYYVVNGLRYGFLGISEVNILASFAALVVCVMLLMGVNIYLLRKGVGIRS
ncbi:MAG: ABC transporter permease [Pseudomonadota bacterium]|nr:ABC transporter permease [Pseudomonadota bacterium]